MDTSSFDSLATTCWGSVIVQPQPLVMASNFCAHFANKLSPLGGQGWMGKSHGGEREKGIGGLPPHHNVAIDWTCKKRGTCDSVESSSSVSIRRCGVLRFTSVGGQSGRPHRNTNNQLNILPARKPRNAMGFPACLKPGLPNLQVRNQCSCGICHSEFLFRTLKPRGKHS
jgi:hypothetical protein